MRRILNGLFSSQTLEARYRRRHLKGDRFVASWVMVLWPLLLLPFLALDAFLYGGSTLFWCLAVTRGLVLALSLGALLWMRRLEDPADVDALLATWCIVVMGADLFLVATRPPHYAAPILAHVFLPLAVYLAVPLNLRTQALLTTAWTGGYLAVLAWIVHPEGRGFWPVLLVGLALAHVLGHLGARRHHGTRRRLYAALEEVQRLRDRAERDEVLDPLTGLRNRRGWMRRLQAEESRFKRLGGSACVVAVDLDGLRRINERHGTEEGDSVLRRTAHALQRVVREPDVVARVDGDGFLVLGVGCGASGGEVLADRIREALESEGIEATVGYSARDHGRDLGGAWKEAEGALLDHKQARYRIASSASS
jgi:diguanylate cyclase (GGDEF)-like protein